MQLRAGSTHGPITGSQVERSHKLNQVLPSQSEIRTSFDLLMLLDMHLTAERW